MKKNIVLSLFVLFLLSNSALAFDALTTEGIKAYKSGNIVKCKETMEKVIKQNKTDKESLAMANYYLAITMARISQAEEAKKYYNKVVSMNTDPNLVLAARKGLQCLDDTDCLNKPLNAQPQNDEGDFYMNEDGTGVNMEALKNISEESEKKLTEYRLKRVREMANQTGDADYMEVEKLEDFSPMPSRPREIRKKKSDASSSQPSDKDIANAVKVLSKAGLLNVGVNPNTMAYAGMNNDLMQINALLSQSGQNNQYDMLPLMLMYQGQNGSNKIPPEAMQMMINNMMMPDFSSLDSSNK